MRVMTFNLRYDNPDDGPNAWPRRSDAAASMLRFHRPDVAGTQEGLPHMLSALDARLDDYAWIGTGREAGEGEHCAIFYRPDRVDVLDHDTFWLSESPDEPGSQSWGSAHPRIVTWAHVLDTETGVPFHFFNTHFDYAGDHVRTESAHLLRQRVPSIASESPVVVVGDFNARPHSPPYRVMTDGDVSPPTRVLHDAMHRSAEPHHGPTATFNDFTPNVVPNERIDYIFVTDDVAVHRHATLSDRWDGRFPSDHCPVVADVTPGAPR